MFGVARDPCCVLRNKSTMSSSKKYLSEKELIEIVRQYEEGDSDAEGNCDELDDSASENEDYEEEDEVIEDEIVANLSENESFDDDDEMPLAVLTKKVIYGKNGYKWYSRPFHSKNTRTILKNLVVHLPGPKNAGRLAQTEVETWKLFFDDDLVRIIVTYTNEEISLNKAKFVKMQRYTELTNNTEIEALLGLLYISGALKDNHVNLDELWSNEYGPPVFRATMSKNRFIFLIKNLRFDNKATRMESFFFGVI